MINRDALVDVVTPEARRRAYRVAGHWDDSLLAKRVSAFAASQPIREAVVDLKGARRFTYQDLERDSNRIANFLVEERVNIGDVVGAQLPNWYEAVCVYVGVLKVGAVINPMLPNYRARELRHMLGVAKTRVLFTPTVYRGFAYGPLVDSLRSDLPQRLQCIQVPDPEADIEAFREWLSDFPDTPPARTVEASQVSALLFTSGTEATPKAVMHTEETANFSIRAVWSALNMTTDDIVWMPSPIGHSTGFNYGVRIALYHGAKLVLQDRWSASDAVALIESEKCTYTSAAATFLRDVVSASRAAGADISSMRLFRSGGAPIPPDLVSAAETCGIKALRIYGSTEFLSVSSNRPDSPLEKRVGTDGYPLDNIEVEIHSDMGQATPTGVPGEIVVRGPNTAVGFFRDPDRTRSTFEPSGWVRSGDIGVIDSDGYLSVVGRKKEIIIRGGLNIAPAEIEQLLAGMPGVLRAAVIGVPDERLGETACAFVVLEPGLRLTLVDVVGHLKARGLATYKFPQRLEQVDELPMTPTGKVQKHVLLSRLQHHSVDTES